MVRFMMSVDNRRALFRFNQLEVKLPFMTDSASKSLAKFASLAYAQSAAGAGIRPFRGRFYANFARQAAMPTRLGKGHYGVSVGALRRGKWNYALTLDNMRPHAVGLRSKKGSLFKRRIINEWAEQRGIKGRTVMVHPHPYIDRANTMIFRNAKSIAEGKINEVIRTI